VGGVSPSSTAIDSPPRLTAEAAAEEPPRVILTGAGVPVAATGVGLALQAASGSNTRIANAVTVMFLPDLKSFFIKTLS
jgi:hypothetical protein